MGFLISEHSIFVSDSIILHFENEIKTYFCPARPER